MVISKKPDPQPAAPERTPENTPIPGGGSWRWDTELQDWAPNDAQDEQE